MKYSIIILITQLLLWGCCRSERSILESFYKALDGDKWEHKENWLSDKPLNEWYGITTDEKGKVVKIQLSDTMMGKVPANLKYLKKLQYLHLNCMAGGIRLEVNKYPSLKELGLNGYINLLTVENCPELEKLSLTSRYFDVSHVDNCPKLSSLELIGYNISNIIKEELDLNLSSLQNLSELRMQYLPLNKLHINNCFNLKRINILNCQIEELNLYSCTNLEYLKVLNNNSLHTLNLNNCTKLDTLNVRGNSITQLDVSSCKGLRYLSCSFNKLSKLELNNPLLCTLDCPHNQLETLDISKCRELEYLDCYHNQLSILDVSSCKKLKDLDCSLNELSKLELNNPLLCTLDCSDNKISKLDVGNFKELKHLYCDGNNLLELDISKCKELRKLHCDDNLSELDLSHNSKLEDLWIIQGI